MGIVSETTPAMYDRPSIGQRISIRGATGSGKSTLGHSLGQRFGLPVVELDALTGSQLAGEALGPVPHRRAGGADACPGAGSASATTAMSKTWCLPRQTLSCGCGCPSVSPSGGSSSAPWRGRGRGSPCGQATRTRSPGVRVSSAASLFCCTPSPVGRCTWRTPCASERHPTMPPS
jgi:hypothetical protein